uniref:Small ribosomal subunit protein mS39 n=1 Tax=Oryzias latipes TaxID=8090 RepID=A0A3P9I4V2_ORYLA
LQDPTAYPYQFQDDPYLSPRTSSEFKLFSLSQESGRSAAKFFVDSNPKFFTKDFAEPHIPCLMPESVSLRLEEVSEEALRERISLRKVTAAVDMYDQLLQAGTAVSMETTHDLLDLICLYCDRNPVQEGGPQAEEEEAGEETKGRRGRTRRDIPKTPWKENNNAERIFNLLPERDSRCYSALIRGMVKHGAYAKAFSLYTDLLNDRLTGEWDTLRSVAVVTLLFILSPPLLLQELLNQMSQQKVHPDLLTFNSVLKALRRCGYVAKAKALSTLNEMKAVGISPSLATYDHILAAFYKSGNILKWWSPNPLLPPGGGPVLADGTFLLQCLDGKDLELGYKVQNLLEVGDNWRLLGDSYQQSIYYGRFFNLLCMMEHIDVVLEWYRKIIPSVSAPPRQDLLHALDTDSRLDMLPTIWKGGFISVKDFRAARSDGQRGLCLRLHLQVQESFAACALNVKSVCDGRLSTEWSASALSHITTLLLRANKTQEACFHMPDGVCSLTPLVCWMLCSEELLNSFLSACHSRGDSQRAVELVQLSAAFCLPATSGLASRALTDFHLTEQQR